MLGPAIILFIIGLTVGSFLNVLTLRMMAGEPFIFGRSHCPSCQKTLLMADMLPVVSYLWLNGRCRYCGGKISLQYPIVELATGIAFVLIASGYFGLGFLFQILPYVVRDLVFTTGLIALFIFDVRWYAVPDAISLPLAAVAVFFNWWLGVTLRSLALGAAVGGGFFFILWFISKGRWVGAGDIRLGIMMGCILGWPITFAALYIAYMLGGAVALMLLLSGKKHSGQVLPMGVFLTTATFLVMLYPEHAAALAAWLT
ncbi:MAG: prepilin peptidase [Patescibacteria group bacterium]|jgi:prepilin signal peptidase PulO-like enzyme (type II secretory pathway)